MRRSLSNSISIIRYVTLLSVMIAFAQTSANAGTGTFRNGAHNFVVSVRWNANQQELDTIRSKFISANRLLYEATNAQHYFANIVIANNSGASDEAEYWIYPNDGRANVQKLNAYGMRGHHINMYRNDFFGGFSYRSEYTIVHELGHHSYDLRDEYARPKFGPFGIEIGRIEDDKCGPPPVKDQNGNDLPQTIAYSIMDRDYYALNASNARVLKTTEFCLGAEHDPDGSNLQSRKFRRYADRSCWNIIANNSDQPYRRAVKPTGSTSPVTNPTPPPLNIRLADTSAPKVVMALCKNYGSYYVNNYTTAVKAGAKTSVDYMVNNSLLGIRSFATPEMQNFPVTQINSQTTRNNIKSAIDNIAFFKVHTEITVT